MRLLNKKTLVVGIKRKRTNIKIRRYIITKLNSFIKIEKTVSNKTLYNNIKDNKNKVLLYNIHKKKYILKKSEHYFSYLKGFYISKKNYFGKMLITYTTQTEYIIFDDLKKNSLELELSDVQKVSDEIIVLDEKEVKTFEMVDEFKYIDKELLQSEEIDNVLSINLINNDYKCLISNNNLKSFKEEKLNKITYYKNDYYFSDEMLLNEVKEKIKYLKKLQKFESLLYKKDNIIIKD